MEKFIDALKALARRKVFPTTMTTRELQSLAPAIRQRAFFSATVASAKVLHRFRRMLFDWQAATVETVTSPSGVQSVAYKSSGLANFREKASDLLISEGLAKDSDLADRRITSLVSNARLKLILVTNVEQSQEFSSWAVRVGNQNYLNAFPAARFVRRPGAIDPRAKHVAAEGEVRRWDDFAFWLQQNSEDIGGFGVPWGPWGFNSYMTQVPVGRVEAIRLGLIRTNEVVRVPDVSRFGVSLATRYNSNVEADVDDITPEIRQQAISKIESRIGPGVLKPDGKLTLEAIQRLRNL